MLEEQSPYDDPYARQETFVLTLFRLFKLATMHDLSNQAIGRGLSHAAQTFGEIFARESTDLSALFTTENVFINGQPLKASRGTYESVLELGRLLERTGFNELRLGRAVSRDDLAQMLEHFVLFRKDPPGNRSVQLTRNVRFKHVDPTFILGDNEGELTIEERVAEASRMLSLGDYLDRFPSELSGGQRQGVAVARAAAFGSKVIILDEPTRGVDVGAKAEIHRLVRELADEHDPTIGVDWHGHRDRDLGIANCLAAIEAGADRVHGTALGVGERAGNAPMDQLLASIAGGLTAGSVATVPNEAVESGTE